MISLHFLTNGALENIPLWSHHLYIPLWRTRPAKLTSLPDGLEHLPSIISLFALLTFPAHTFRRTSRWCDFSTIHSVCSHMLHMSIKFLLSNCCTDWNYFVSLIILVNWHITNKSSPDLFRLDLHWTYFQLYFENERCRELSARLGAMKKSFGVRVLGRPATCEITMTMASSTSVRH